MDEPQKNTNKKISLEEAIRNKENDRNSDSPIIQSENEDYFGDN